MKKGMSWLMCAVLLVGLFCLPVQAAEENYALGKPATASSIYGDSESQWGPTKAFDGDSASRWASKAGQSEYWIQVDLEQVYTINKMKFEQYETRVTAYSVEVSADGMVWETAAEGKTLGSEIALKESQAQYVRLNILQWTKEPTFYEIVVTYGEVAMAPSTENLAKGCAVSGGPAQYGSYSPSLAFDGDMGTRWASAPGTEVPDVRWLQVDLGAVKPINQMKIYEMSPRIQEYKIIGSVNGEDWTDITSGTLPATNANNTFDFAVTCVRYVKLEIYTYKDDPTIWEVEVYCTDQAGDYYQYYRFADALTTSLLTDQPTMAVAGNLKQPPETLTSGGLTADVTWISDNPDVINIETGEVVRQAEDTPVTITAQAAIQGLADVPPVEASFTLTVKAAADDIPVLDVLPEGGATVQTEPVFWDVQQISGYTLQYPIVVEMRLSAQAAQNMTIDLGQKAATFAQVQFSGDSFGVAYGQPMRLWRVNGNYPADGAEVALRFEINQTEGTMDVLVDNGAGWQTILNDVKGCNDITSLDQIVAQGEGGSLTVHGLQLRMSPGIAIGLLKNQFDFTKVSEEKPMRVTKDLNLPKTLLNAPAVWQSSNAQALDPETGKVDVSYDGIVTLGVSAAFANQTFTKEFRILFGGENLLRGAQLETTGKATSTGSVEQLLDEDLDAAYMTRSASPYEITITLPQSTTVSHLVLYEAPKSSGKITQFRVQAKKADGTYEEIASGTEIGEVLELACALRETTELKLCVDAFESGSTGLSEVTAFYRPNAQQILEGDLAVIEVPEQTAGSFELPGTGKYGSNLVWSSGTPQLLELTQNGGQYTAAVTQGRLTQVASLRVDASYDGASVQQGYQIEVTGTGGSSSGGSSGGGGGGGGGGSASSGNTGGIGMEVPIVNGTEEQPQPTSQPQDALKEELKGHWGETELAEMVDRGILKGDGTSLHLLEEVTRAEFASMLVRALALPKVSGDAGFQDVQAEAWYAQDVAAVAAAGLMQGDGGLFRPEAPITREEMAKVLIQAYTESGKAAPAESALDFTDAAAISTWAQQSVAQAVSLGLIQGYETGEFLPQSGLLREQAAVVLYRLMTIL